MKYLSNPILHDRTLDEMRGTCPEGQELACMFQYDVSYWGHMVDHYQDCPICRHDVELAQRELELVKAAEPPKDTRPLASIILLPPEEPIPVELSVDVRPGVGALKVEA